MKASKEKYIIICYSTSEMLNADRVIKSQGIHTDLVPTPIQYGSICSTSIAIAKEDRQLVENTLKENNLSFKEIHPYESRKLSGLMESLKKNIITHTFRDIMSKIEEDLDITKEEITYLLKTESKNEIEAIFQTADQMRKEIVGDVVEIRGAIEFSNHCKKNCNYCGIRRGCTVPKRYRMEEEEIMEVIHQLHSWGIKTVILQSGEDDYYTTEILVKLIRRIKRETKMMITLSIGERSFTDYETLREAGANNFLLKIETTNKDIFKFIHPDDDFDERLKCSKGLRQLGYVNGSGNMIGLPGQRPEDIAEDILFFKDMAIHMIGIGPFIPAKGTPFELYPQGSVEMTLRAVAITRLVCKNVFLPATTALASIDPDGQTKALQAGANTIMLISTPAKYRSNYQIYSNKNMIDLQSAFRAVKESGRKLPKYLKISPEEVQ
ncbi:[FeFe] hydrogenase H-cluster radical SAM maturase HydE [Natronincola ferrireducens]|uniref:Iron-only hydrogenase maturation protein HydE n=1 Tax=Natronincola ferrireducens TaxID=393762 RepID=A0A1G9J8X1_9FIRM|nr:[FeFe] hydrogenase H-cluster radical SAM maturase HydE [Natronincola ferrireducens]SDL33928.1 iron-only hydrogenase maturation protein HydE [Natronincola ferrireducens]